MEYTYEEKRKYAAVMEMVGMLKKISKDAVWGVTEKGDYFVDFEDVSWFDVGADGYPVPFSVRFKLGSDFRFDWVRVVVEDRSDDLEHTLKSVKDDVCGLVRILEQNTSNYLFDESIKYGVVFKETSFFLNDYHTKKYYNFREAFAKASEEGGDSSEIKRKAVKYAEDAWREQFRPRDIDPSDGIRPNTEFEVKSVKKEPKPEPKPKYDTKRAERIKRRKEKKERNFKEWKRVSYNNAFGGM